MEDKVIEEIQELLTWKSMSKIAILYLGFEQHLLGRIWEEEPGNVTRYIREVIKKWRDREQGDKASKLQKFADILYESGEVYHEDVKDILKVDRSKDSVEITKSKSRRKLSARTLGQLSEIITSRAMETIAIKYFGASFTKVDNKKFAGNGYWWFTLGFLVDYAKKPDSSPQGLKNILFESDEVDKYDVEIILNREGSWQKSTFEAETGSVVVESSTPSSPAAEPTTSEGQQSKEDPNLRKLARKDEPFPQAAGSWFPDGYLCKELSTCYDDFGKIRALTNQWKDSTKPVMVAVLDSGIYEDHEDLKGKILTDYSKCFLPDAESQDDLRKDSWTHGTMVAGIIAESGPKNLEIINLKVCHHADGRCDMGTLVKALEHVRDLKLKDGRGVDIINMSLSGLPRSQGLDNILCELGKDKILVAAAGNEGAKKTDTVTHPAKHPMVIAVGAHDVLGHASGLSAKGRKVMFLCPGEAVVSTCSPRQYLVDGVETASSGFGEVFYYKKANGTSFASAYAAAVAAHVLVTMEARKYRDTKAENNSEEEAKKEGLKVREQLCSSAVMMDVLARLTDKSQEYPGVLRAYELGFEYIDAIKANCAKALKGY